MRGGARRTPVFWRVAERDPPPVSPRILANAAPTKRMTGSAVQGLVTRCAWPANERVRAARTWSQHLVAGRDGQRPPYPLAGRDPGVRTRRRSPHPGRAPRASGLDRSRLRGRHELLEVETGVEAALRQELVVGAALHDPAALVHQDLVGAEDRREPVRDRDRGPALHDPLERPG